MDYVMGMGFEEAADFDMLKALITTAAAEANLDIFDNIFDWSVLLTDQKRISSCKKPKHSQELLEKAAGRNKVSSSGLPKSGSDSDSMAVIDK